MYQQQAQQYLLKILHALEGNKSAILVGGQCLLVWATYFESLGNENLQVATRDIDLMGNRDVVRRLEKVLNVKPMIPEFDHVTPEVGVFHVPLNGEYLIVDVLGYVAGLSTVELEKYSTSFNYEGKTIRLLNPIGMLKSRVGNVLILGRTGEHSMSQLRSSIKIVNLFISALLNTGYSYARKDINALLNYASSRDGLRLYKEYGIDILDALPKDHSNYPAEYINKQLPLMMSRIEKKRNPKLSS